jgi:hypothetical protein
MPFDSNGTFTRIHCWEDDRQNDIDIASDRHDEEDDGFADALSQCLLKDGRSAMTGNLKMGGFSIRNVASGTAQLDAVNYGQLNDMKSTITSDTATQITTMLTTLYPVGSVYIGTQTSCPLATLISDSTWELVSSGNALWTGTGSNGNTTIEAGLPNITGQFGIGRAENNVQVRDTSGSFSVSGTGTSATGSDSYGADVTDIVKFNASSSNSIYGKSSTVQPPAYVVNVWRRTA